MKLISTLICSVLLIVLNFASSNAQAEPSTYVVYRDQRSILFNVASTGSEPIQLTPEDVAVRRYDISIDGVVIYATNDYELFAVPLGGGEPVKLNRESSVYPSYVISSDGKYVVYTDGRGLYSAQVSGGEPVQLNSDGQEISIKPYYEYPRTLYDISPDSSQVIFTAFNARNVSQLYTVPIAGGETVQLNPRLVSGGNVTSFSISPDSERIVYVADQKIDEVFDLFSVAIAGGDTSQLNLEDAVVKDWAGLDLRFSPDGQWVVCPVFLSKPGDYAVMVAPLDSGPVDIIKSGTSSSFRFTKDSSQLFILAGADSIFEVPLGGNAPNAAEVLNKPTAIVAGGYQYGFVLSPDDTYLIFAYQQYPDARIGIVSLTTESFIALESLGYLVRVPADNIDYTSQWTAAASISPNGKYIVTFYKDENSIPNLYSIEVTEGKFNKSNFKQLSAYPGSSGFRDQMFRITADSANVIYINDEEAEQFVDLYSVPIDGGDVIRLTPDDSKGVVDFKLYPKGSDWYTDFPNKLR